MGGSPPRRCPIGGNTEGDAALAAARSRTFSGPAPVVRNHDSDILQYELYDADARTEADDSWPGDFDEDEDDAEPAVPSGGDPLRLCAAFAAAGAVGTVAAILQATADDDQYVLADDRRRDLLSERRDPEGRAPSPRAERPRRTARLPSARSADSSRKARRGMVLQ